MGFRLVPKSVIVNDLERRNGRVICVISPNSVNFRAHPVKVVEDTYRHILRVQCSPKNLVFSGISLMAIFAGADHPLPSDGVEVKRPPVASENLIIS